MESSGLRLAQAAPRASASRWAATAGAVLLAMGGLASGLSADAARRPAPTTGQAQAIVREAIQEGSENTGVRGATRRLRSAIGARPLDARTRVLYAGVLADLAASVEDFAAAVFHARRAVLQAPVTVPVVRSAALVLVRCGEADEGVALAAAMFAYDASAAAKLIALLEPYLDPAALRSGIPEEAAAWSAWIDSLRRQGRAAEADARLAEAQVHWPAHRGLFEAFSARAVARQDWDALEAAFARSPALRSDPAFATLFACRSRLASARGRTSEARADAQVALSLARGRPGVLLLAGDALDAASDLAGARAAYRGALHTLASGARRELRAELLARLARMEERRGHLGEALRAWRELLDADPSHGEALRGVARLTAGSP